MHGQGKITFGNGDYYQGEWKEDKRDGFGVYLSAYGQKFKANWKDGKLHGYGEETFQDSI